MMERCVCCTWPAVCVLSSRILSTSPTRTMSQWRLWSLTFRVLSLMQLWVKPRFLTWLTSRPAHKIRWVTRRMTHIHTVVVFDMQLISSFFCSAPFKLTCLLLMKAWSKFEILWERNIFLHHYCLYVWTQLPLSLSALTASRALSRFTRYFCSCSKYQSQSDKHRRRQPPHSLSHTHYVSLCGCGCDHSHTATFYIKG